MPGWDGEPGDRRRRPPPRQPRTTRVARDSSFPGAPQPGPGMPPALAPGPGWPAPPASAVSMSSARGSSAGKLAAINVWRATDWIRSPASVVWLRVIRPCPSTSTSFECEPGQTKTRPSWPGSSRPLRVSSARASRVLHSAPRMTSARIQPSGPASAGSQSRHEMDRPRPDLWKCTSHHGIGQLGKARGRKHVRHRQQAFIGREHPGGDDQIRARRCSRSLRRPIV